MTSKIFLRLLTVPTITGATLAMGLFGLTNGVESSRLRSEVASEVASCGTPREPGPRLRSRHGGTLVASVGDIPLPTVSQTESEDFDFGFSAAESDAAVALFGCDCPACLNALQQLRNQPPAPQVLTSRRLGPSNGVTATNRTLFASSQLPVSRADANPAAPVVNQPEVADLVQGHCWVNLQERATPADIQAVLQTLEAEETTSD